MELFGSQACFVYQQQNCVSPAYLQLCSSSSFCFRSCCGAIICPRFFPSILQRRNSNDALARSSSGTHRTRWKWNIQWQELPGSSLRVEARATISAARRNGTARRRSTSQKPEESSSTNVDLELEILEFMVKSGKSDTFPSKADLISAGRLDLADAILAEGGWLAAGWDRKGNAVTKNVSEIAPRPSSRRRGLSTKSKTVTSSSSRRSKARYKLGGRGALPNDKSACESFEPEESKNEATPGVPPDESSNVRRDGNSINDAGAASREPVEKERTVEPALPFFEQVRKDQGSRFPSTTVEYLWEFGSLADFIRDRKNDAKSGIMHQQQWGLSRHSSRLDLDAASRASSETCDTPREGASNTGDKGQVFDLRSGLDNGSTVRQDPGSDPSAIISTGFDKTSSARQGFGIDQTLFSKTELDSTRIVSQDPKNDQSAYMKPRLDKTIFNGEESGLSLPFPTESRMHESLAAGQDRRDQEAVSSNLDTRKGSESRQGSGGADVDVEGKLQKKNRKEKKPKKTKKEVTMEVATDQVEINGTLDWINQMVDQREKWMLESKSSAEEGTSDKSKSVQDRIRSLEDKLTATRTALQSGRGALEQRGDKGALEQNEEEELLDVPSDVHKQRLTELRDASDDLEHTENKILRIASELTKTRAQVAALKGTHGLEIMETRRIGDENERKIENTMTLLESMRAARIVWPHPAKEVYLIGSFDGWNQKNKLPLPMACINYVKMLESYEHVPIENSHADIALATHELLNRNSVREIKMETSGAGVFVATVPLHPGRYEIKFIVDGTWRVDTLRPIVYVGGYENNVLIIPESYRRRS